MVTLSDSSGYIYDEEGIDRGKLEFVKRLKNLRRGRIKEYIDRILRSHLCGSRPDPGPQPPLGPQGGLRLPQRHPERDQRQDAANLVRNGVKLVCEGANMPSTPEAIDVFLDNKLLYAPGKAANAGGVAVSGLEMAQNSMRLSWPREEVDGRLQIIMKSIHATCLDAAAEYGHAGNYMMGANIAGFVKVVNAMQDQGVV